MAVLQRETPKGRDFTAEELIGRQIRIEGPVPKRRISPLGHAMMVIADDEMVNNACKIELAIEPCGIVEAKITLYRFDRATKDPGVPTEEITLRDNIEVSFSAIVSEVQ
jgi:hypothetical protein